LHRFADAQATPTFIPCSAYTRCLIRGALVRCSQKREVVVALFESAKRGWNSVTVKGLEAFWRGAWAEAVPNRLQVAGYKLTELDLAQLKQREPAILIEPGAVREQQV
jgi:hypothetical protein